MIRVVRHETAGLCYAGASCLWPVPSVAFAERVAWLAARYRADAPEAIRLAWLDIRWGELDCPAARAAMNAGND